MLSHQAPRAGAAPRAAVSGRPALAESMGRGFRCPSVWVRPVFPGGCVAARAARTAGSPAPPHGAHALSVGGPAACRAPGGRCGALCDARALAPGLRAETACLSGPSSVSSVETARSVQRCGLLSGCGLPGTPSSRLTGAASPNGGGSLAWDRLFPRGPARAPHSRRERKHKRGQGGRGEGRSRSRWSACKRETVRQKSMLTGIKRNFKKENESIISLWRKGQAAGGRRPGAVLPLATRWRWRRGDRFRRRAAPRLSAALPSLHCNGSICVRALLPPFPSFACPEFPGAYLGPVGACIHMHFKRRGPAAAPRPLTARGNPSTVPFAPQTRS